MPSILMIVLIVMAAAAVAFYFIQQHRRPVTPEVWPFVAKRPLTTAEQVLYFRLVEALPEQMILAQVQLSRCLGVKKGHDVQAWINRISRLSADFVVCAKDASVLAVIELDDSSHDRPSRQDSDARKEKALTAAGVRLIRWRATALPDIAAIKSALHSSVSRPAAVKPAPSIGRIVRPAPGGRGGQTDRAHDRPNPTPR